MKSSDPQFLYMVLILPSLFALTLIGEGVYKLVEARSMGWLNIAMGIGFMGVVLTAFFMLSGSF